MTILIKYILKLSFLNPLIAMFAKANRPKTYFDVDILLEYRITPPRSGDFVNGDAVKKIS